ncbi:MAG TPA: formate dehydrogenase accessory protein FdhE [Myxococcaceae bacterium]|nr:formate dehydrogenase accessory protein FdhE [Myxococcaceae bacterium]
MNAAADRLQSRFEQRAARADALAEAPSSGREPLRFAAGLFRAQARAAAGVLQEHGRRALSGTLEQDLPRVESPLRSVLRFLAESGPVALRDGAASRAAESRELFAARLRTAWTGGPEERQDFLSHAVLRPYAEALVHAGVELDRSRTPGSGRCPACGAPPSISFRKSMASSDGAARFLGCGLCGTEWQTNRIRCPSCGETDPDRLPGWQSETFPTARVEACETCQRYVKSVDMTIDGLAVPEVDELRSLSLDLWAVERGYVRLEPGLAGL